MDKVKAVRAILQQISYTKFEQIQQVAKYNEGI